MCIHSFKVVAELRSEPRHSTYYREQANVILKAVTAVTRRLICR